jgi:dTDP-4-amino-4,6-dideoxygalactose transaminase
MKYLLNIPNLSKTEYRYVIDVLKTGWLSSNGKHNEIAQKNFGKLVKKKYN